MKNFILDTNVLLHDPQALFKFQENNIIIPITVIEEVDRFKKDSNETGRNARQISRILDAMREKGSLSAGIVLPEGGTLRVEMFSEKYFLDLPVELRGQSGDNRILGMALSLRDRLPDHQLIFVTKDTNLRIKADAIGVMAEDYESDKVDIQDLYSGTRGIEMSAEAIDRFHGQGWLDAPGGLAPNEFIMISDSANPAHSAACRFDAVSSRIVPVRKVPKEGIWRTPSSWLPWWARRAPARRSWPSPPVCTRWPRTTSTTACWYPGRSFPWARTWASSPVISRRS